MGATTILNPGDIEALLSSTVILKATRVTARLPGEGERAARLQAMSGGRIGLDCPPRPSSGTLPEIRAETPQGTFSFLSTVEGESIATPQALHWRQPRTGARARIGGARLLLRTRLGDRPVEIAHVSTTGIGFRFSRRDLAEIKQGSRLDGTLQLPGIGSSRIAVDVIEVRDAPGKDVGLAGVKFRKVESKVTAWLHRASPRSSAA
ncbi:MAG: hypothetical protein GY913_19410 [Proteobacteria bacterium]|nr:hypothetical protein [Pseudomonadota bacterium]MCP4919079.1 hypothetical protein [Pseudomonadota bacterium]